MKLRLGFILTLVVILSTACNFTLAEDITPPPGFIPPTPMPTLGALFPASAPDIANGAAIYAEKCAACHGAQGMGDGEQGKLLPVPVAAVGLPEVARQASPAKWFTTVSQGNLDRFMPPFTSLSEQERWDVVAYALSLHTQPDQIELGRSLFEANCAGCAVDFFADQEKMAGLTQADLVRMIKEGDPTVPALGDKLTEDEQWSVAAYLRSLTFSSTVASIEVTPSPESAGQTPSAPSTPTDGTPQVELTEEPLASPGFGPVSGTIENKTGSSLPTDFIVTLRAFEHGADPNTGPQEILSLNGPVQADGSYIFENVELVENRIFIAQAIVDEIQYQSEFAIAPAASEQVSMPTFAIYAATNDTSTLALESVHLFFDYANETTLQIFSVYSLSNPGDKTVRIGLEQGQDVPFIKFPAGAESQGYEATQDSAAFVPTSDGFAIPPSDSIYGLIAFASMPREKKIEISQPVPMHIRELTLFLPTGVKASGEGLAEQGLQSIQGTEFNIYTAGEQTAGSTLEFTLSGLPRDTSQNADLTQNQTLLIGVGALGLALILAGAWLYWRDRSRSEDGGGSADDDFENPEELMDAIVALDDQHRSGKLNEAAYRQRRSELKARLKEDL